MCGSRRWHATRTVGPWPSGSRSQARHWHVRATVRRPVVAVAERRLLGIDLGVTTAHTVAILDQAGQVLGRRRCRPTVESLEAVEAAALRGTPAGTRLEVVVEPTGAAWLPVAVFFAGRGHTVFRVPSAKAAAGRPGRPAAAGAAQRFPGEPGPAGADLPVADRAGHQPQGPHP